MRGKALFTVLLLAAVILDVSAEKRRIKKGKKHNKPTESPEMTTEFSTEPTPIGLEDFERQGEDNYHEAERLRLKEMARQAADGITSNDFARDSELFVDACVKMHCSAGRVCELDNQGEAVCNCIKECPNEVDERRKVCTSHNETWGSDCEVHQQRCLCMTGAEGCKGSKYSHVQVDYYGRCREMPVCVAEEMEDFPRRMRDWLFNIMRDLADRHELSDFYLKMEKEAESNLTRRWTNAAIWKWCDLDANDNDRFVSRHELFPIRAPLMSLEHCIGPFLNSCDVDDDHRITLTEWGKCLNLEEDYLEDKCDDFNEANA